jgi:4-carboxymuconolactone decarboxylase
MIRSLHELFDYWNAHITRSAGHVAASFVFRGSSAKAAKPVDPRKEGFILATVVRKRVYRSIFDKEERFMTDRIEAGREVVRDMLGEQFLAALDAQAAAGGFGSATARLALGSAFGDVWARPGLEGKMRSMVTMGILIALRLPAELKNHVRAALANGCTPQEIEEAIIQAVPYAGFPCVAVALSAAAEVLKEKGLLGGAKTAEERGLL